MKHQQFLCALIALLLAIGLSPSAIAQESTQDGGGEITTLYALDALTSHLSLNDGKPGAVIQGSLLFNRDSQLSFDTYTKDSFRVGIQGGEQGGIVDLGSADELRSRYGYSETVGNVQGFTSIHLEDGRAMIVKDYRTKTFQPLREFDELGRDRVGGDTAPVVVGHTYLVRIKENGKVKLNAKLKVLAFVPGQYVTIRWSRL
jgi:hypothetical protein